MIPALELAIGQFALNSKGYIEACSSEAFGPYQSELTASTKIVREKMLTGGDTFGEQRDFIFTANPRKNKDREIAAVFAEPQIDVCSIPEIKWVLCYKICVHINV